METKCEVVIVRKSLEKIASDMCEHYCKYPDEYSTNDNEDEAVERLMHDHCNACPIRQFLI